ncbi:MAG: hypothetical protein HUU02_02840 [Bacteroidetes bacterium]|nr:hypothetical protein [Bacteroidota bacterium]
MRIDHLRTIIAAVIILPALFTSCGPFSETRTDRSAALNGGFEVSSDGLPVNWSFYSPATLPGSDFTVQTDSTGPFEGTYSLLFSVKTCSPEGGRLSPGMFRELEAEPNSTYQLQFAVRNDGSRFRAAAGGVTAKSGTLTELITSDEPWKEWKDLSFEVTVPEDSRRLRFELSILQPGSVRVDGFRFRKVR